jgi:hypothetical protein
MADSVRIMKSSSAPTIVNLVGESHVDSASAFSYWFTFSFYYYGSPALLAEQEVRKT